MTRCSLSIYRPTLKKRLTSPAAATESEGCTQVSLTAPSSVLSSCVVAPTDLLVCVWLLTVGVWSMLFVGSVAAGSSHKWRLGDRQRAARLSNPPPASAADRRGGGQCGGRRGPDTSGVLLQSVTGHAGDSDELANNTSVPNNVLQVGAYLFSP